MYGAQMLVDKFHATVVGFACLALMETNQPLRIDKLGIYILLEMDNVLIDKVDYNISRLKNIIRMH